MVADAGVLLLVLGAGCVVGRWDRLVRCVACGKRAVHRHHACYAQELRRVAGKDAARFRALFKDDRNLVAVCVHCHVDHHNVVKRLPLSVLPDSVFEFAAEVLGGPAAYEYLVRRYEGKSDGRLRALISDTFTPVEITAMEDSHADAA
jgi:hypothetical protein